MNLEELRRRIRSLVERPTAPPFLLTDDARDPEDLAEYLPLTAVIDYRRHRVSGTLQIEMATSAVDTHDLHVGYWNHLVSAEDQRRRLQPEPQSSESLVAHFGTSIHVGGGYNWVPVVGPGGGVTISEGPDTTLVDVVVRPTGNALPGRWRAADDIVAADEAGGVSFDAWFGYLELSQFEHQTLLRPVALVVAEPIEPFFDEPGWREALALPLTSNDDYGLDAGLGSWLDEWGGCGV